METETEVIIERFKVSRKLKIISYITTAIGFLMFAYPVVFIISLIEKEVSIILYYLNKIFFLTIPELVTSYIPTDTNAYILYAIIYVLFAILMMIISNFLLERNLLAIAFSFVIFLSLAVSEYLVNPSLFQQLSSKLIPYLIFALIPLILIIMEIITEKDFKNEQLYVKIIISVLIIGFVILSFKGLIWLIQNKSWIIETFSSPPS
ncbi:hypothetical protein AMJ47_02035 [Parcubacteria bacterium DG_72]|nr:MAG: hypothetical protein AMJ47_02035 [Parcubacteria bacterium DG_72]